GHHHFGTVGTIACAVICMVLGIAIARLPESMAERSLFKSVERGTDAELQAIVDRAGRYSEPGSWNFYHTLALLQLAARGRDVAPMLPRVLDMLDSDSSLKR